MTGLRLKKESPYAKTTITTKANGMSAGGYMPDDASYGNEAFEVRNTSLKSGCTESAIVNGNHRYDATHHLLKRSTPSKRASA